MVVGYDTYHDTAQRNKSVGGFVCSVNPALTKWYSKVSFHGRGGDFNANNQELSDHLRDNFSEAIKKYYDLNKALPDRVVIYRDGVGEGQIEHVYEYEVGQIKKVFSDLGPSAANIKLAFIIVTKRINARFFEKINNHYENPQPGTIVDNTVTRRERYDFFLISQSVRQGTVAPTMYNIIEDTTTWQPKHHQMLAYKMTHLYYNWPVSLENLVVT